MNQSEPKKSWADKEREKKENAHAWKLFIMALAVIPLTHLFQRAFFAPKVWTAEKASKDGVVSEPDADPFPIIGSEEQKQAWRGRHPIKTWTQPSTW